MRGNIEDTGDAGRYEVLVAGVHRPNKVQGDGNGGGRSGKGWDGKVTKGDKKVILLGWDNGRE